MDLARYRSHGVPLESYELTRRDHQDQRTWEQISKHVDRLMVEERAKEETDPNLRRAREEKRREAWELLRRTVPDHQIMRWRVRLYCGHIAENSRNVDNASPRDHGSSSMTCPTCGKEPSGIVAWEPIGLKSPSPAATSTPARSPTTRRRPSRAELERQVRDLQEEVRCLTREA